MNESEKFYLTFKLVNVFTANEFSLINLTKKSRFRLKLQTLEQNKSQKCLKCSGSMDLADPVLEGSGLVSMSHP